MTVASSMTPSYFSMNFSSLTIAFEGEERKPYIEV